MEVKYITRGMSDPQGKPPVWFSCHPADLEKAFPLIPEDILSHANCAVWYDPLMGAQPPEEDGTDAPAEAGGADGIDAQAGAGAAGELDELFERMQLIVLAVSSTFLHEPNRAKDVELPLALEKHIPVLPILIENGIGYEFSNTCAKIQVVRRYEADPTATPYEEVLKTFLSSVLVGDELAEKVRNAFDAYVFLSYRKKDRRHAHRLMRLIHENEQFRDIAIWYDEYLVPGESFNDAIKAAFKKSSLFAMAVTPHLEEKNNYVMRVEYPMARDRKSEQEDFEIVPVEMYEPEDKKDEKEWRINTDELKSHEEFKYKEIPGLRDEHRRPEVDQAFLDALGRIAKKENDGSAQHRFFIGLAYLNGIDVEVDVKVGKRLLVRAALDPEPCLDASAKLCDMYRRGKGTERNLKKAIRWQRLQVMQCEDAWNECHDPDEHRGYATLWFKALRKLAEMYREDGDFDEAADCARRALDLSDKLTDEVGVREQERDRAMILNLLGNLYKERGDLETAGKYYKEAAGIYEKQASEIGTSRARWDVSISWEKLGDLARKRSDLETAEEYYLKAGKIREELNEADPTPFGRRGVSSIMTKMGNVRKSQKRYDEAGDYYKQALGIDSVLAEEVDSSQSWDDYGVSLIKVGDIHKTQEHYDEAYECYRDAFRIFERQADVNGSRLYQEHLAAGLEKMAGISKRRGNKAEADQLYREAIKWRSRLVEEAETVPYIHSLAASYYNAASVYKSPEMMNMARELWSGLSMDHPEYAKYRDKADKMLEEYEKEKE